MSMLSGSVSAETNQSSRSLEERLFVALDYPDAQSAVAMAEKLAPLGVSYKVGLQLFYAEGMSIVHRLQQLGNTVFVDVKLHDIPNTVAGAVDSLVRQGVDFLNVHAQGGPEMMQAAAEAARSTAKKLGKPTPKVIAVTLLTSLSERHLAEYLFASGVSVSEYVQHLAMQAHKAGLNGVVCSAQEAAVLREECGPDFLLVTPGIRPKGADVGDQSRVITPADALRNGADYLVVGRPITGAADPVEAARRILDDMLEALA